MFDFVIRDALIVDGRGGRPYSANLAVQDGRIAAIGLNLGNAGEFVDANSPAGVRTNGAQVEDGQEYLDHARPPGQVLTEFAA